MEVPNGIVRIHRHFSRLGIQLVKQTEAINSGHRLLSHSTNPGLVFTQRRAQFNNVHLENRSSLAVCRTQWRTFFSNGNVCQMDSRSTRKTRDEPQEKEHFPTNEGMNLRLSVENDYLSWMRNSYIMTLGGVSMLHFDLWDAGHVAGAAALLTSTVNLMIGSVGYVYNVRSLRQRGHISNVMGLLCHLWAVLHFIFWGMVLMIIFPDYKLIELEDLEDRINKND